MIKNTSTLELVLLSIGFLSVAAYPVALAMAGWMAYRYLSSVKKMFDNL